MKKLKEIKTVYVVRDQTDRAISFDKLVNEYLAQGWILAEIRVIEAQTPNVNDVFYARLEKMGDYRWKSRLKK